MRTSKPTKITFQTLSQGPANFLLWLSRLLFATSLLAGGLLVSGFLAGCSLGSVPAEVTPTLPSSPTPTQPDPAVSGTLSPSPTPGPVTLRVWVPPQFDPQGDTPAARLFASRLRTFIARRPGIQVDVRVKAVDGPGGLLDSLSAASAAAPLAMPDLVALPHGELEAAALKGLLRPFNGLTSTPDETDWYEYARQLGRMQNSVFGLPFSGDALVLVYRPLAVGGEPPQTWEEVLAKGGPLVFPAADPQALFTLAQYQARGGIIRDDQGRPALNASVLAEVLTFYQSAEKGDVLPFWLTQYQTDEQVWEAFLENRTHQVITWASRYLSAGEAEWAAEVAMAPLPTPDGSPTTLATGWVWALASPHPERQAPTVELAEYLSESAFLADWNAAAGFLPTRPSALELWPDDELRSVAGEIAGTANLYPSADVLTSLGSALEKATVQVLKEQTNPQIAAQDAAASLEKP